MMPREEIKLLLGRCDTCQVCPLGEILVPIRKATTLLPGTSPLILLDEGQVCRAHPLSVCIAMVP